MTRKKRSTASTRSAVQLAELAWAAPQVVAHRLGRMAQAGPILSDRDRREFTGMVVEKQLAFAQAWAAMGAAALRWQQTFVLSLLSGASWGQHRSRAASAAAQMAGSAIAPVHRKAVANARRLARTRVR